MLNFGLSPDFSVQLKVSLTLRQKLKWPNVIKTAAVHVADIGWFLKVWLHAITALFRVQRRLVTPDVSVSPLSLDRLWWQQCVSTVDTTQHAHTLTIAFSDLNSYYSTDVFIRVLRSRCIVN